MHDHCTPWLFDGPPHLMPAQVPDADALDLKYIVFLELSNARVLMFATRTPARALAKWHNDIAKMGEDVITRVLVSAPHARSTRVKQALFGQLADGRTLPDLDTIRERGGPLLLKCLTARLSPIAPLLRRVK